MSVNILDIITGSMILSLGNMTMRSIDRYSLYYYAGALCNMTICWLENGAKEAPEQMAEQFLKYSIPK